MWLYSFLGQKLLSQLSPDNDLASQICMTDTLCNVIQKLVQGVLCSQNIILFYDTHLNLSSFPPRSYCGI
jgi:hypothetical protein